MKTVVLLSGGMDSATLLAHQIAQHDDCIALGVDYGQRHIKELVAATAIADHYDVEFFIADLSSCASHFAGSSQTSPEIAVPHGHYTDESMKVTVVPNRNMVLLAHAGALAMSQGCQKIAYAAHAGDRAIYWDCREDFAGHIAAALALGGVELVRPFILIDKAAIAVRAHELQVPLGLTWSCYEGGEKHCGQCGTCVERREALALAGFGDPTEWAA